MQKLLINTMLNHNRNKTLKLQIVLTLLLLLTQIMELNANRPLKRIALIYYVCVNSLLLLLTLLTTIGLAVTLLQIILNSKLIQSERFNTLHYWY